MQEILNENLKKRILNYLGFRFSRQRRPLSSFKIQVIIFREETKIDNEMKVITKWKEI